MDVWQGSLNECECTLCRRRCRPCRRVAAPRSRAVRCPHWPFLRSHCFPSKLSTSCFVFFLFFLFFLRQNSVVWVRYEVIGCHWPCLLEAFLEAGESNGDCLVRAFELASRYLLHRPTSRLFDFTLNAVCHVLIETRPSFCVVGAGMIKGACGLLSGPSRLISTGKPRVR